MSILGTCQECLHYADGMCDLRPRICFNYDHFERLPMVTLRRDVFETQYISRAMFDAELARLTELQRAASEFIGYIKAGNNAKAHLQMLFLEVLINEESKNGAKK